jgi:hypothetical protein
MQHSQNSTKRKACTTVECLRDVYQTRVNELNNYKGSNTSFAGIAGNYTDATKNASLTINDNLSFIYDDVNEQGNMCYIEAQLIQKGNLLTSNEDDCEITIKQTNQNSINFSSTGCQCGMGMDIRSGTFTRKK